MILFMIPWPDNVFSSRTKVQLGSGVVAKLIKLLLAIPACHMGVPIQVPASSFWIQFLSNVPGKIADDGLSVWVPAICMGN